ncbi:hypothetical protein ONZ43_g4011 [Nemania bipapillata]|uniref:Uncharacterized protein n=1 Tax=Nemania bipapillata TaxID=110536 RepID=A0ACC2ISY9_9PEZI|nr:hypothetical protein ONZ43_g4011 [Nemania bipapillata]
MFTDITKFEDVPIRDEEPDLMSQVLSLTKDIDIDSDIEEEDTGKPGASPDVKSPQKSTTGLFPSLKKMVSEAKGAASNRTKLIFVVGQSGTGKSTFLREISGVDLPVGKTRNSGTRNYHVCPALIDGEQYLFIDTPGFGAADMDDMDSFAEIIACLQVLGPFITVAGLIFVTGGNQERLTAQELKTIQWLKCFCGPEFYKHVTIMTNKWDKISDDDFEEAWESMLSMLEENPSLSEILNPQMSHENNLNEFEGGYVYHHGVIMDEGHPNVPLERLKVRPHAKERADMATTMIKNRYKEGPSVKLQVIRELGNSIPWNDTEAAKVLKYDSKDIKLGARNGILQVFMRNDEDGLYGKNKNDPLQLAADHQGSTNELVCVEGDKASTQLVPGERDDQRPFSKVWPWLLVAKDVAVFFMKRFGIF